jgi:endonuclease/exonuclease/phosphatase (EEP) superfamily protein YafD
MLAVDVRASAVTIKRRRATSRVGWLFAMTAAAALAFADLLPQDLTDFRTPYLALCAAALAINMLQLYLGLFLMALAVWSAWRRRPRLALANLIVALWAAGPMSWQALPLQAAPSGLPAIRVMSMNLLATNRDVTDIDREVRAVDPDIVCMQEIAFFHEEHFRSTLGVRYPYVQIANLNGGVAIYSKLPLHFSADPRFAGVEMAKRIRCEVEVGGATLALYCVHVPRFSASIASVGYSRLELAQLLSYVRNDPLPVVIAGDFNFSDETGNAALVRETGLRSAHAMAGSGFAMTRRLQVPVLKHVIGARIDHVYLAPPLTATRFQVAGEIGSDHLPIVVDVALNKPFVVAAAASGKRSTHASSL